MFTTLKNAFKIKEIRNKLLFTLGMLVVIRLASQLPVPGTNSSVIQQIFDSNVSDAFNFFNAFTGGSFTSFSIAALNITPRPREYTAFCCRAPRSHAQSLDSLPTFYA